MATNLNLAAWLKFRGYSLRAEASPTVIAAVTEAMEQELAVYGQVQNAHQYLATLIHGDAVVEVEATRPYEGDFVRLTRLLDYEKMPYPEHVARLVVLGESYGGGDAFSGLILRDTMCECAAQIQKIITATTGEDRKLHGPMAMLPYIRNLKARSRAVTAWMASDRESALAALEEEYGI